MPKVINFDERRDELARTAMKVISVQGVSGATLRDIADEAGVSVGVLQHSFRTRRSLLLAAFEMAVDRVEHLVDYFVEPTVDGLKAIAINTLPLNRASTIEWKVLVAFRAEALADVRLSREQRRRWQKFRKMFEDGIQHCIDAGDIPSHLDAKQASFRVVSAIDGVAMLSLFLSDAWKKQDRIDGLERMLNDILLSSHSH